MVKRRQIVVNGEITTDGAVSFGASKKNNPRGSEWSRARRFGVVTCMPRQFGVSGDP
jgi:hypothetical protein